MADFTQQLPGFAIIPVKIRLGSLAGRAGTFFRDVGFGAALYRFNRFTILPDIVVIQIVPVPILVMIDDLG